MVGGRRSCGIGEDGVGLDGGSRKSRMRMRMDKEDRKSSRIVER